MSLCDRLPIYHPLPFLRPHSVEKVVWVIMGMRKGEVKGLRQTPSTFEMQRAALSCVFCVKDGRKCQNRCPSAAELLANSAPFAVTRHPEWHYRGSLWDDSSSVGPGETWIERKGYFISHWRMVTPKHLVGTIYSLWPYFICIIFMNPIRCAVIRDFEKFRNPYIIWNQ